MRDHILKTMALRLCPQLATQLKREALRRRCARLVLQDRAGRSQDKGHAS